MTLQIEEFCAYRQAIVNDIWIVDECYDAIFFISDHYKEFGAAPFLKLFGRLQDFYFTDAMILAVGRLFDKDRQVLSLPNIVRNCERSSLKNKLGFISELRKLNVPDGIVNIVEREGLSSRVAKELQKFLPTKDKLPELKRVIGRRHEDIAHRAIGPKRFDAPFFSDIKVCSEIAKNWIACFALGIEDCNLRDIKGGYCFSSAAKVTTRQMRLLLQFLYLIPSINGQHTEMIEEFYRKNIRNLSTRGN